MTVNRGRRPACRSGLRQRRNLRQRRHRGCTDRVGVHRLCDVFDLLFPDVLESVGEPVADMVANRARDAHAAGLRQNLQACCDVDAVAVDVVALDDYVAEIDPDPEVNALVLRDFGVAVDHRPLDLGGAADRVDDARKLD